jgi:predicted RNA binding protein with dsRBD fold (UPF0201 family)
MKTYKNVLATSETDQVAKAIRRHYERKLTRAEKALCKVQKRQQNELDRLHNCHLMESVLEAARVYRAKRGLNK